MAPRPSGPAGIPQPVDPSDFDSGRPGSGRTGKEHRIVNSMPYPVVAETRLEPVARRFGSRTRRNLDELPKWAPGTALVFQAGGRFVVFDERRHLSGSEDFVLDALAVAVVNMRAEKVTARLELPSLHPSERFTIL